MPRRQRLQAAGLPVHIIQRGNNRQACFFADDDYQFFLDHLARIAKRFRCALHAYVLMANHFHLLLSSELEARPSLLMEEESRRAAYRGLFESELDPQLLREIRVSTHGGYAIGNSRFREDIESALKRRATPRGPGRPIDRAP